VQAAVAKVGYSRLVLSACTPLFSAAKRLLVFARLTRTVAEGAQRRMPGGGATQPIEARRTPVPAVRRALPPVLQSLDPHVDAPLVCEAHAGSALEHLSDPADADVAELAHGLLDAGPAP